MQKEVRAILGLTLLLGAFTVGCDNNPLKADRDKGSFMYTNPSFGQLQVDGTTKIRANVMNKYSSPTGDAVSGTPCDAKITAVADTSRTPFEQPERFVVTGVAPGHTCLIVSGGGVTDTVDLIVGPKAGGIHTVADSLLPSGASKPLSVTFTPAGSLTISDVIFSSRNAAVAFVDTTTNTVSGRAPGTTFVITTLRSGRGQIVTDSQKVIVTAGAFTGVAPAAIANGSLVSLTAGAIPFDADTKVTVNGDSVTIVSNTATTYTFVAPTEAVGSNTFVLSNLGPNQVASTFTANVTAEAGEPDSPATARAFVFGSTVYGSVSATDTDDYYTFTAAAAGTATVDLNWVPGGTTGNNDVDVIVLNPAGTHIATACESSAHPEHCTFTMVAGTTYRVQVESFAAGTIKSQPYVLTIK